MDTSAGRLRVAVLGPVRVWLDDRRLSPGSSRQQAVLAVLAANANKVVPTRTLIAGVWGGSAPASATGNLHTYVSRLRTALGPARHLLASDGEGYSLRMDSEAVDSARFTGTHAEAQRRYASGDFAGAVQVLGEALALWQGEPYAGVRGPFAEQARRTLVEQRLDAARLQVRARLELGEHADAAAELVTLVREHPLDERLRELLMVALHRDGRQADALEVFHEVRLELSRHGARPGTALVEAHQRVLAEAAPQPTAPRLLQHVPADVPSAAPPVLVGREAELEALSAALTALRRGRGRAVWVEGEAGIGKSALLAAALSDAGEHGCHVAWASADELTGRFPLQAVLDALELPRSVGDHRRRSVPASWDPTAAMDRVRSFIAELCATAPLVLVVDDLQWGDDSTLLLWDRLITATEALPLLLVAATRPEICLSRLKRAVGEHHGVTLSLGPMADEEVEHLLTSVIGVSTGPGIQWLIRHAAGNPRYATEMVEPLMSEGGLQVVGGVAEVREVMGPRTQEALAEALRRAVQHISTDTHDVLRSAALLGEEFEVDDLAAMSGRSPLDLLPHLDEAVNANILAESGDRLAFRHPFLRRTLHADVPRTLRATLHRQAAEALAAAGAPVDRITRHLVAEPQLVDPWVARWVLEQREAVSTRSPEPAAELLRRVLEARLLPAADQAVLRATLVEVLNRIGRHEEATALALQPPGPRHGPRSALDRLREARSRAFVGRDAELGRFRTELTAERPGFAVHYLVGPGGIGKTTLLRRFEDEARQEGRPVISIDSRAIAASPAGFEAAAGTALATPGVVLLVDTFERCQALEGWLREAFLPRLPEDALVVMASRLPPDVRWRTDPAWYGVLRVRDLEPLTPSEAEQLMDTRGVPPRLHGSLHAFAGGHPLALVLASEVAVQDARHTTQWQVSGDVLTTLLDQLVGDVPSPAHRHALQICAHLLNTTQDALRVVFGDEAEAMFEWLRRCPFVEAGPYGLYPHDVVRDVLNGDLRWRDPEGWETMHRRMRAHLIEQAMTARGPARLPAMFALNYLHRYGDVMPRYLVWRGHGEAYQDVYRPADRGALLHIAAESSGERTRELVEFWLDRKPEDFVVYRRSQTGEPVAFLSWLRLKRLTPEEAAADPLSAGLWAHAERVAPVREGEHVALARFIIQQDGPPRPSPVADLMILHILAESLQGENVAWAYLVLPNPDFWQPMLAYQDHHRLEGELSAAFAHDWRQVPVRQWLERSGERLLQGMRSTLLVRPDHAVLAREAFDAAVSGFLRDWHDEGSLAENPLLRTRLSGTGSVAERVAALRSVVLGALGAAAGEEAAALVADLRGALPFDSRWHTAAVRRLCDALWARESPR